MHLCHVQVGSRGGDSALGNWPSSAGPLEVAFGSLLDHVHTQGLSPPEMVELRALRLIPVANGTSLAPINQVFTRVPSDLSPFAFEIPVSFSEKATVLRGLGMKDEVSARVSLPRIRVLSYQHISLNKQSGFISMQGLTEALSLMAVGSEGRPLNANECNAVVRLLEYLSGVDGDRVSTTGSGRGLSAPKRTTADLDHIKMLRSQGRLLVLSASCRLISASEGVYYEAGDSLMGPLQEQLHLVHPKVIGLEKTGFTCLLGAAYIYTHFEKYKLHCQISATMAAWLGCRRLSDVVKTVLVPGCVMTELQELPGITLQQVCNDASSGHPKA